MSEQSQLFAELVRSYYAAWFRFHPELAVELGIYEHAQRLTPFDDDDIGALLVLNEKLLSSLDEIDTDKLAADEQIDYEVLYGGALLEHHDLMERDWRRRDPAAYIPVSAIYQLQVRPVPELGAAMRARLGAIPDHLRGARSHLSTLPELVPSLWLQSAVIEARAGTTYLASLVKHPQVKRAFANISELRELVADASRALEEYASFLERDLAPQAQGSFACGRDQYERILRRRHFLDIDADQLRAFGLDLLQRTRADLEGVTLELQGDSDVAAFVAKLKQTHPASSGLLDAYRVQMAAAHKFVEQHDLVTLPPIEHLTVVETPIFLQHQIPFAAYLDPAPNDPQQQGHYYVTPTEEPGALAEHYFAGIGHTCVHEAWPGHHLQFVTANLRAESRTLPRLTNNSAMLYEGWALYCEQMMQEEGFLDLPEQRFILLRDRLWRALRIVLDVELHTRELDLESAIEKMMSELGFPRSQALADLTWYTRAPGVPMGYATGWAMISAAREQLCRGDDGLALKEFHDRLLASGSISLPLVIKHQFGAPLLQALQEQLFSTRH